MDEFAASAAALSSPFTHPHTRRAADRWLTRFQSSPDAWAISQQVLASPADPRLRLLAAQVFAHKVKRQLDEVAGEGQRHALLDATAAQVAAAAACGEAALARALSVALAHLMLQCPGAARPLERVSGLGQAALLQFFTILADEAEGAVAAAVAASGEAAFELRQRVRGWGAEVCGWLRDVLAAALYAPANLAAMPRPPGGVHEAVLLSGGPARAATAEVARCFAAWVKWGALDSSQVDPGPGAHLLQAASALLFLGEHDPALAELGVDAVLEAVEHAPEASQAALAALALRLPGHVASLAARGADAGQLAHVFACFCSTHAALAASSGPEGAALRAGLLLLLGLPLQGGAGTAASAALDGVSDVLEAAAGAGLGRGEACESAIMDPEAAEQFAAAVLGVLLRQLELPESSFAGSAIAAAAAAGDEEGGPEALRLQAEVAVELCAQQLSPEGLMPRLQAAAQAAAAQHGAPSLPATRAADVSAHARLRLDRMFSGGWAISAPRLFTCSAACTSRVPPRVPSWKSCPPVAPRRLPGPRRCSPSTPPSPSSTAAGTARTRPPPHSTTISSPASRPWRPPSCPRWRTRPATSPRRAAAHGPPLLTAPLAPLLTRAALDHFCMRRLSRI